MTVRKTLAWTVGASILFVVVAGVPEALLVRTQERARGCFAAIEETGLEDCGARALRGLKSIPWTRRRALLIDEEIDARMVAMRYLDAAVGEPDPQALAERFAALADVERRVVEGSGRIALDFLGPRMGVPVPEVLAQQAGDRRRLIDGGERWLHHNSRAAALDAALLEGEKERAVELARNYRETPSAALRLRAAALLCAGGAAKDGMRIASEVETERADDRKANFSSNFGGARVVVEACAALAHETAPAVPAYGNAGDWDQRARAIAVRLRQLCAERPRCLSEPPMKEHLEHVHHLLSTGRAGGYRLELVALIAESLDSGEALAVVQPKSDEPAPPMPVFMDDFVDRAEDAPYLRPELWEAAADHLSGLDRSRLADAIAMMRVHAAVGYALQGSLEAADRCVARLGERAERLGIAVALLSGDRNEARRRSEAADARDAAALVWRAELRLPDRDAARAAAEQALSAHGDARTSERARWLLLSLGARVSDSAPPPRVPVVGRPQQRIPSAARERDVDELFATWQSWLSGSHRAARWRAFRHGGDAPDALAAYLLVGGQLADNPAQIETWLDALLAKDARRFSLRRYALARWQAAAWRGDASAEQRWRRRFRELATLASEPATAELMQASRL